MAEKRSDTPREFADKRAEVLSDSTELDDLLAAILGEERAPASVEVRPRQAVEARPELTVLARPQAPVVAVPKPTLVPPPRVTTERDLSFGRSAATDDEADASLVDLKKFLAEVRQQDLQASDHSGAAAESAQFTESASRIDNSDPLRTWRDMIPVPTSKQSMIIAGLSAAALITLSASVFLLRDDQGERVVPASPAAGLPTLVPPTSAVEPPITAPPAPTEVEVTPPRETTPTPRVITPPSSGRASERTNTVAPTAQPRNLPAPTAAPVAAPPAVLQRVVDEPVTAPTRAANPENDPPRPADTAPTPAAAAPAVTGGAEPVAPASATSVPAGVARRTPPRLVTGGAPEYPAALRNARVGGAVEVRFTIDSSGRAINVQAVTGPPQLRPVAEATVRRWRYDPARLGNVAVDTQTSVNFNFDPSTRRPQD